MNWFLPLLAAFGLGSVVTAFVQSGLTNRSKRLDRVFAEKQTAYIGLLEAYHRAAVESSDETSKLFAYWQMRCELVASEAVRDAVRRIVETNDDPKGRLQADSDLKVAMRADLGITK
ncbi:MAG TPA: hypothetical protein VK614_13880 [Allosphingosinicella sp.]|nr:hypothetical protein [Allosphingosinicella sp.]